MHFDGALVRNDNGKGIVLNSSSSKILSFLYWMEFDCPNIMVEYEALLLGLRMEKDKNIRVLKEFGDSNLGGVTDY